MDKKQKTENELQEILRHQQAIKDVSGQIEALRSAIKSQEESLAQHQAQLPDLETLEQQRENLLADIATGKAEMAQLDKLDGRIEAEQAASNQLAPLIVRCNKTLAGLNRKLQEETELLGTLQKQSARFQRAYLLAEAELEAEAYVALGGELVAKFSRLSALSILLDGLDCQNIKAPGMVALSLPAFNLKVFPGNTVFNRPGALFVESPTAAQGFEWAKAEKENLRALGVEIE